MPLPYENATSGLKARQEILGILKRFGCESVGFMDEFVSSSVLLAFSHRGRQVQLRASAQGWADAYLRENPWSSRRHYTKGEWKQRALDQGLLAVNSILRDWVKGQMTAVETGILEFDHVFMPYMLAKDGRPMIEHIRAALPAPQNGEKSP